MRTAASQILVGAALPATVACATERAGRAQAATPRRPSRSSTQSLRRLRHGADGKRAPRPRIQVARRACTADYITHATRALRGVASASTPIMQGMAAPLSSRPTWTRSASYFAPHEAEGSPRAKDAALGEAGRRRPFRRAGDAATGAPGLRVAPFGLTGAGLPKSYPRDSAASAPTTPYAQREAFQAGERARCSDPAGNDRTARSWPAIAARGTTDAQMKAVADYMAGLRNRPGMTALAPARAARRVARVSTANR